MKKESILDLAVMAYGLEVVNAYNQAIRGKDMEAAHVADQYMNKGFEIAKREGCFDEFVQAYKDLSISVMIRAERAYKEATRCDGDCENCTRCRNKSVKE